MRIIKKLLVSLAAVLLCCTTGFAQTVSNVVASQEGNSIVVSYEIDKSSPEVGLTVSTDGGKTFSAPLTKVTGDVKNVQPGRRRIVWDVLAEVDKLSGDKIVFNVIAASKVNDKSYEYVDLGLSVKWATCNVGAARPEEYGSYFAWGETGPKDEYTWSNLKYCNNSIGNSFSKYVTNSRYGRIDNKTCLEMSDDAARSNWGGNWRVPTRAEWMELKKHCTWTWTTMNGKYGHKVVSQLNGKSIFLPAAGYPVNGELDNAGSNGCYWSSSLYSYNPVNAYYVHFDSSSISMNIYYNRYYGLSVRPVSE